MIKAKKLRGDATIMDLVLNECYIGKAENKYITLNNNIRIKTSDKIKGFLPVRIKRIAPPNKIEIDIVKEDFEVINEQEEKTNLFLKSNTMKKLAPKITKAAKMIKETAENKRLIILRHHADCDGYSGALALESVIMPIIEKQNSKVWQNYKRLPMRTPFYDYQDALKDLSYLKESVSYGKKPMLIIVDNGCGEEDILALKRIKLYEVDIIIIDHHLFSEKIDNYCDIHINPRTVGKDGDITSGMLCFEIARLIGKPDAIYPALSGISDKSSEEIVNPYIKLVGKDCSFLKKLAACIDFEAYNLRFMDSSAIHDLFNNNQKKTMDLILPEIEKKEQAYKAVIKKFLKEDKIKKGKIYSLNLETATTMGYPAAGKITGLAHSMNKDSRATLGIAKNFITIRIDNLTFSLTKTMNELKKKIPHGMISGGGHDYACTIKFIHAVSEEVKKIIIENIS